MQIGDPAPAFSAQSHTGDTVALSDYLGTQAVVVFFYPKSGTPVCTKEACSFRDSHMAFVDAGAAVIGISADDAESQQQFAQSNALPFPLLSDTDGALRKAFEVPRSLGFMPGRTTYVIDREGIVRHIFSAPFMARQHVTEALNVVQQLLATP